jgi:hypothetical protein
MGSVKDFYDSVTKLKIEVGATDEEMERYLPAVIKDRSEKYSKRMADKYPLSLQQKAFDYFNSLSPLEQNELGERMETVLEKAIEANPDAFTADEVRALFTKDGQRKPLTPGVFDSPIRDYDRARWNDGEGELVEEPKASPPQSVEPTISIDQARSMDLEKLRMILPETVEGEE